VYLCRVIPCSIRHKIGCWYGEMFQVISQKIKQNFRFSRLEGGQPLSSFGSPGGIGGHTRPFMERELGNAQERV